MSNHKNEAKLRPFFNRVLVDNNLQNDAALCRALGIFPALLSNTINGRIAFGPAMILRLHERLGIPVKKIRAAIEA